MNYLHNKRANKANYYCNVPFSITSAVPLAKKPLHSAGAVLQHSEQAEPPKLAGLCCSLAGTPPKPEPTWWGCHMPNSEGISFPTKKDKVSHQYPWRTAHGINCWKLLSVQFRTLVIHPSQQVQYFRKSISPLLCIPLDWYHVFCQKKKKLNAAEMNQEEHTCLLLRDAKIKLIVLFSTRNEC